MKQIQSIELKQRLILKVFLQIETKMNIDTMFSYHRVTAQSIK